MSRLISPVIWTIGHGNRSIDEFLVLLKDAGIECLVDVRAYPASRRHPQFARESLDQSLADAGVRYVWEGKALGGRRKLEKNSPHVALNNPGFRAYAGHLTTEEFRQALDTLVETGRGRRTAIMCAERLPWECHRSLIADYLVARGENVVHLISTGADKLHRLNPLVNLRDGTLVYDGEAQGELKL
jgi:uncharacterized protein (DUF488 family)